MSQTELFVDRSPGETRGVLARAGRPHRLLIQRDADAAVQRLGARSIGRVARLDRALGLAFVALADGPEGAAPAGRLVEGRSVDVRVVVEAQRGKGPALSVVGEGEGPPRLLQAGPDIGAELSVWAPGAAIETGPAARAAADAAEDEALQTMHALPGGGRLFIEPTQALVAVDIDVADRRGSDPRRIARQANLAAVSESARLLGLKTLGGLVVLDLVGKGHDGPAISAAAKAAFDMDAVQASVGPISRFGLFELSLPRSRTPVAEILRGAGDGAWELTCALRMLRRMQSQARSDRGAVVRARSAPAVAARARPYIGELEAEMGGRFALVEDPQLGADQFEVST